MRVKYAFCSFRCDTNKGLFNTGCSALWTLCVLKKKKTQNHNYGIVFHKDVFVILYVYCL